MRGSDQRSGSLFSYVDLDARVRKDHPLGAVREIVNAALALLHRDFEAIYASGMGRPSIPPERLLRALLLQAFYGIRSERQIMERLDTDLLFRWFVERARYSDRMRRCDDGVSHRRSRHGNGVQGLCSRG